MSKGDVAPVQPRGELRMAGRRRMRYRWMAMVVCVLEKLVIVGSALPWTQYAPGGDTPPVTLSGVTFPSEWGVWALMIGGALIFGALLAMSMVNPYRYLLLAVPAAVGVALCAVSCVRRVRLDIGTSISGSVGVGLALALAACVLALAIAIVAEVADWHWRRVEQVLADYSSSFALGSRGIP
jgi:hypothetical protein